MIPVLLTDTVSLDVGRAARFALLWGLEGVVLRHVGGMGDRVPFINEGATRRRLDEDELDVFAVDPGLFEGSHAPRAGWLNEIEAFDEIATFCSRIRSKTVRVGALASGGAYDQTVAAEALRQLGDRAAQRGLRLAVRNESGTAVATGAQLASLLSVVQHPSVGADWQPADALQAGEEPTIGLLALHEAGVPIESVSVRDGETTPSGAWNETVFGDGGVPWQDQLDALQRSGFSGPLVLDVRLRSAGPEGLAASSALIRMIRQATKAT